MAGLTDLERTMIEWRCSQLVARFALLNDAYDYDNMALTFTEDAVFTRPTMPDKVMQGRQAIMDQFRSRPARTLRHLMANTVITVESAERATGVCYMILYAGPPLAQGEKGPPLTDQAPMIGAFRDVFVKVGEQWLFAERRGELGLTVKT